jgi:hypothetical protein
MLDNPPLPIEFGDDKELRIRAERWRHLSTHRRISYLKNCIASLVGYKRRRGLLPKKT